MNKSIITGPSLEVVADDNNRCGEAPLWDFESARLIWADIESALVYAWTPANSRKTILSRDLPVSGITLHSGGGLVFAGVTGLHLWRNQDDHRTILSDHEGEKLSFNDIIADCRGRIYAGTLFWGANGMEKPGKLYLINQDGSLRVVDEDIQLSNGLGFSPDCRTLYHADSAARTICAYQVDGETGHLSHKKVFVKVPSSDGVPDGLTVDAEGFVWCAQWYGAQVVRYDPDGKPERRIPLPVRQVSSVAFGGPDLNELYITSAADSWSSDLAPPGYDFHATNIGGPLYRVRLDIQGKPEYQSNISV